MTVVHDKPIGRRFGVRLHQNALHMEERAHLDGTLELDGGARALERRPAEFARQSLPYRREQQRPVNDWLTEARSCGEFGIEMERVVVAGQRGIRFDI